MEAWLAAFIESLERASDLERQRRAWTAADYDVPDPAELICQIFDDSAVGDFLEAGPVFSEAADASLRRLSSIADRVELQLPPDALLASAVWIEFAREAGRALSFVRTHLGEPKDSHPDTCLVYVRLLGEGTTVFRPTRGAWVEPGTVRLLAPDGHDADDEQWEFNPGTVVRVETRMLSSTNLSSYSFVTAEVAAVICDLLRIVGWTSVVPRA